MEYKYKVGDKVILTMSDSFHIACVKATNDLPDRVDTIKMLDGYGRPCYYVEEMTYPWFENEIEGLAVDFEKKDQKINNRFEILDL